MRIKCFQISVLFLLFLLPVYAAATTFYISNSGSDNNSGTGPDMAWRTIDKLNASFALIKPGDNVLFKRGDIFFGSIRVTVSGSKDQPVSFGAYGTGNDPVISGFTNVKGWTKKEKNIWQAPASFLQSNLNLVTIDDVPQQIGRYPNAGDEDGGYLRYENFNEKNEIIDSNFINPVNWTGSEIVVRKNHWTLERCRVTKQEGGNISFTFANTGVNPVKTPPMYKGTKGNGYFFQNDYRALDIKGEWFFDSTSGYLQMVLEDTLHNIMASAVDTLVNTANRSFLSFSQLVFEGANRSALFNRDGGNISIQNCRFNNMGAKGIHFWNTGDVLIENVTINNALSNAVQVRNSKKDNVVVRNCVIKNTGLLSGMGSYFDDRDYKAVSVSALNNVLVENNSIDSTGLSGIQFQGNNVLVQHNLVNHYCLRLDDGAGIYTFVDYIKENAAEIFFNRVVKNNIILNGRGAPEGSTKVFKAEGIYTDGRTMNVDIIDNSIAYVGNKAFACNNAVNINIRGNICYNNGGGWGLTRGLTWMELKNFELKQNVFYSTNQQQALAVFSHSGLNLPVAVSIWEAVRLAGDIDSNYYSTVNPVGFNYNYAPVAEKQHIYPSPLTFEHWQEFTGQDVHSKRPAVIVPLYSITKNTGGNLVKNGTFDADMADIHIYGAGVEGAWDGSGKITGGGSLKVECTHPQPNRYSLIWGAVGGLQANKKYRFRFKTFGTSDCGIVKAYLRKTKAPHTTLTPVYTHSFGLGKNEHEFLLVPKATDAMSFVIEVEKNSCIAYIDDVELNEAEGAVLSISDHVRFEYNASEKETTIVLDKNYVGVDGRKYTGSVSLLPFTSIILIEDKAY
jgi:hypothetical protein